MDLGALTFVLANSGGALWRHVAALQHDIDALSRRLPPPRADGGGEPEGAQRVSEGPEALRGQTITPRGARRRLRTGRWRGLQALLRLSRPREAV